MTDGANDGNDAAEREGGFHEPAMPFAAVDTDTLLGNFSVVSPGVEIVLDGRAISAPAAD